MEVFIGFMIGLIATLAVFTNIPFVPTVHPADIKATEERCAAHGGWKSIENKEAMKNGADRFTAICNDTTKLIWRTK